MSFLQSPTVGYALPLRFPVMAPHFVTPVPLDFARFGQRWGTLADGGKEKVVLVTSKEAVDMKWAAELLGRVNLTNVAPAGAAASQPSVYGAGLFRTTTVRNGQRVGVGVLLRLDGNAARGMWRLVVRTQAPPVTAALAAAIGPLLGEVKA